jgi:hypothetical protein
LRMLVRNTVIWRDLQTPTVKEEIRRYSSQLTKYRPDLSSERASHKNKTAPNTVLTSAHTQRT